MAQITDYTSLISEVKLWLVNTATTDDTVKGWIQLAEAKFRRELKTLDNEERSRATVPTGLFIALPDDFNGLREAYTIGSPNKPLMFITPAQMTDYGSLTGNPLFMTVVDGQFKFSPDIAGDEVEVVYYRKLINLTVGAPTNYLLLGEPDVYLSGTLAVAQKFLRDDVDASQHIAIVDGWIADMKAQSEEQKWSGQVKQVGVNPVVARLG